MAYEIRDNSGALFKNDKKEKDTQPDYKGNVMVNGVKKDIAAWLTISKSGKKYLSLKFSDPYVPEQSEHPEAPSFHDDDIPNFNEPSFYCSR